MWRRLSQVRIPALLRLLILFAILTVPLLATRVMHHLESEAGGTPARSEVAKRL